MPSYIPGNKHEFCSGSSLVHLLWPAAEMCVCVVCVCLSHTEREREREHESMCAGTHSILKQQESSCTELLIGFAFRIYSSKLKCGQHFVADSLAVSCLLYT